MKPKDGRVVDKIIIGTAAHFSENRLVSAFAPDKIVRFLNFDGEPLFDIRVKYNNVIEVSGVSTVFTSTEAYGSMLFVRPRTSNVVEIELSAR